MTADVIRLVMESSVRALVLAVLIAFLLAVLRVRSSALRHATWTMVLGAMLLMPALPSVVPAVRVQVPDALPAFDTVFVERDIQPAPDILAPATPTARSEAPGPLPAVPRPASAPAARVTWPALALAVYLGGVALLALRLAVGWRACSRLRRTSEAIIEDLPRTGRALDRRRLAEGGCSPHARFYQSANVTAPVTVGALSPRIVLPAAWRSWPTDKVTAILAHEQAHVRRRDPLVALLAALNHALFWFHPVAWWLRRTLAVTAEHACDEAAVRALRDPRRYAEVLIDMAEVVRRGGGRLTWQVGVGGIGLFGQRIDRVLGGAASSDSRLRKGLVIAGCVAAIAVVVACRRDIIPPPLQEDPAVNDPPMW